MTLLNGVPPECPAFVSYKIMTGRSELVAACMPPVGAAAAPGRSVSECVNVSSFAAAPRDLLNLCQTEIEHLRANFVTINLEKFTRD